MILKMESIFRKALGGRPLLFTATLLAVTLCACRSPQEQVNRHLEGIRLAWQTNVQHQANLPVRQVDWPGALELLLANNPKLRQTRVDYTNNVENYRQIFRELIPTLNAR